MRKDRKKRRSRWIDIGFLTVVSASAFTVLLLLINSVVDITSIVPKSEVLRASVEKPTVTVESAQSPYEGITIVKETTNDEQRPFSIEYPQSEFKSFNDQVAAYVEEWKERFAADGGKPGELAVSFETAEHSAGVYSFAVRASIASEEKQTADIRVFRINPQTGKPLDIVEMTGNDPEKLKRLATAVRSVILEDSHLKGVLVKDRLWAPTEPKWANYRNFALSDDSMTFYYGAGVIAEKQAGSVEVKVPLEKLNPFLAQPFQVKAAPSNEKRVALTFDDGPDPYSTPAILDVLEKYDAKATFFMLGSRVKTYPDIAKQVAEAGHEIGNHSWNHPSLPKLPDEKLYEEIQGTTDLIKEAIGQPPAVFRPPYGAVDERVFQSTKLPVVMWTVDTLDWQHRDPQKLLEHVMYYTHENSIILMHDIHQSTADGLEAVMEYLTAQGFTFVKVSEIEDY